MTTTDPGPMPLDRAPGAARRAPRHYVALGAYALLCVLAAGYFVYRGPYRCIVRACPDLTGFFASGIAWVSGENPYDTDLLNRLLHERGAPADALAQIQINPPMSLPWFALLSGFSYPVANILVMGVNVLLVPTIVWMLLRLFAEDAPSGWANRIFLVAVLAWAPVHTAIAQGQNALVAMALLIAGVGLMRSGRQLAAGFVFAVGATIRPSFFLIPAVWFLFHLRQCRRLALSGVVTMLVVNIIAIGRLELADIPWYAGFTGNVAALRGNVRGPFGEGTGSVAADYLHRFLMLDLHPLLGPWGGTGPVGEFIPLVIGTALVGVAWWLHRRRLGKGSAGRIELLDFSILAVLILLSAYNRFYCAILLLVPLAWVASAWNGDRVRWLARGTALLLTVFLVPGVAVLLAWLPPETLNSAWLRLVVLPHQTYALILVLMLLLVAAWRTGRTSGSRPGAQPEME